MHQKGGAVSHPMAEKNADACRIEPIMGKN